MPLYTQQKMYLRQMGNYISLINSSEGQRINNVFGRKYVLMFCCADSGARHIQLAVQNTRISK